MNPVPWVTPMPLEGVVVRGARVYTPDDRGVCDVLVLGGRVAAVGTDLDLPRLADVDEVDARDLLLTPALVDGHCHPIGGGGSGGHWTRNPALPPSAFIEAGIGTAVGCLGHDTTVRRPEVLLERVRYLRQHGITAYMFTGEIGYPPATLTGSIRTDLALILETVGTKAAIAEHGVAMETWQEVAALAGETYRGSRVGGKPAILHLHIGLSHQRLAIVVEAIERGAVDPKMITLTHVNWNEDVLRESSALAAEGVNLDVTACIRPDYFPGTVDPADAIRQFVSAGVSLSQLSVSSDAGGGHFENDGTLIPHRLNLLGEVLRNAATNTSVALHDLLKLFTSTPASRLGLMRKGVLEIGADADLLLLGADLSEQHLLLGGRRAMTDGIPTTRDPFEEKST